MQTRSKIFDDISQLMTNAMGVAQGARTEAETAVKGLVDRWLAERNLVTREEFEAVREMAARAREENEALKARVEALERRGIAGEDLAFEGSFGRTTLEYYDGFVFGLFAATRPELQPVATGGRYDALTRVLGRGRVVPAVGGVIRPEVVAQLRGAA